MATLSAVWVRVGGVCSAGDVLWHGLLDSLACVRACVRADFRASVRSILFVFVITCSAENDAELARQLTEATVPRELAARFAKWTQTAIPAQVQPDAVRVVFDSAVATFSSVRSTTEDSVLAWWASRIGQFPFVVWHVTGTTESFEGAADKPDAVLVLPNATFRGRGRELAMSTDGTARAPPTDLRASGLGALHSDDAHMSDTAIAGIRTVPAASLASSSSSATAAGIATISVASGAPLVATTAVSASAGEPAAGAQVARSSVARTPEVVRLSLSSGDSPKPTSYAAARVSSASARGASPTRHALARTESVASLRGRIPHGDVVAFVEGKRPQGSSPLGQAARYVKRMQTLLDRATSVVLSIRGPVVTFVGALRGDDPCILGEFDMRAGVDSVQSFLCALNGLVEEVRSADVLGTNCILTRVSARLVTGASAFDWSRYRATQVVGRGASGTVVLLRDGSGGDTVVPLVAKWFHGDGRRTLVRERDMIGKARAAVQASGRRGLAKMLPVVVWSDAEKVLALAPYCTHFRRSELMWNEGKSRDRVVRAERGQTAAASGAGVVEERGAGLLSGSHTTSTFPTESPSGATGPAAAHWAAAPIATPAGLFGAGLEEGDVDRGVGAQPRRFPKAPEWANRVRDLFELLVELARAGVLHNDVSPSNVMYSAASQCLVLIDWGFASEVAPGAQEARRAFSGTLLFAAQHVLAQVAASGLGAIVTRRRCDDLESALKWLYRATHAGVMTALSSAHRDARALHGVWRAYESCDAEWAALLALVRASGADMDSLPARAVAYAAKMRARFTAAHGRHARGHDSLDVEPGTRKDTRPDKVTSEAASGVQGGRPQRLSTGAVAGAGAPGADWSAPSAAADDAESESAAKRHAAAGGPA